MKLPNPLLMVLPLSSNLCRPPTTMDSCNKHKNEQTPSWIKLKYIYSFPYPDEYQRLALSHSVFSFPDAEDWVPHWAGTLLQYLINLFITDHKPGISTFHTGQVTLLIGHQIMVMCTTFFQFMLVPHVTQEQVFFTA